MLTCDKMIYTGKKLSDHIIETPEGFIICKDVRIARTGKQKYLASEIGLKGNDMVIARRDANEVFDKATIGSFNGKPFTLNHPNDDVTVDDVYMKMKGTVQNTRHDDEYIIADIVVYDKNVIKKILSGELREISCGYSCNYVPNEDGTYSQTEIRGNHVALVDKGRAGGNVSIKDNDINTNRGGKRMAKMKAKDSFSKKISKLLANVKDEASIEEVAELIEEMYESSNDNEEVKEVIVEKDEETTDTTNYDDLMEMLTKIHNRLDTSGVPNTEDEDGSEELEEILNDEETTDETAEDETEDESSEDEVIDEDTEDEDNTAVADAIMKSVVKDMRPLIAKLPTKDRKAFNSALTKNIKKNRKAVKDGYKAIQKAKPAMGVQSNDSVAELIEKSRLAKMNKEGK